MTDGEYKKKFSATIELDYTKAWDRITLNIARLAHSLDFQAQKELEVKVQEFVNHYFERKKAEAHVKDQVKKAGGF